MTKIDTERVMVRYLGTYLTLDLKAVKHVTVEMQVLTVKFKY